MDKSSSHEVVELVDSDDDGPDFERHPIVKEDLTAEDIFRCETQMIDTYGRQEYRNPETHQVEKVTHAFSFCNHSDISDDVLEKVIRETWKDLFALTGPHDNSLVDEWPDRINYVDSPTPGIEKPLGSSESEGSCRNCDLKVLRNLTKHHLDQNMKSEVQEEKEDILFHD